MTRSSPYRWQIPQPLRTRARSLARTRLGRWVLMVGSIAAGCEDPVQGDKIAALGPEDPGVPPGPLHRPGQPCLVCHASSGPAPRFTVAGTVYRTPSARQPLGGIQVRLIDAARRWFVAYTNCAGNFTVTPKEYEPVLPLWVSLSGQGLHIDMESAMNKDGDCGACHQREKSPSSAGPVYLTDDPAVPDSAVPSECRGSLP